MITSIEQLPIELWISIFSYLEAHEIFHAFSNLNIYFNKLIFSDYMQFHVKLGQCSTNPLTYSQNPYWPDSILARVLSLQSANQDELSHIPEFLYWHYMKLNKLKHLKVKIRGREIGKICFVLEQLNSLEILSLKCAPNQQLLETIISASNLRVCQLEFLQTSTINPNQSNQLSHMKKLDLKLKNDSNYSVLRFLLNHMPYLQYLSIHNLDFYAGTIPLQSVLPLVSRIETLKLCATIYNFDKNIFKQLCQILPNLKQFHLDIIFFDFTEDFFNYLIEYIRSVIKEKQYIQIFIRCQQSHFVIEHNVQINLDNYQLDLLSINEQYHGKIDARWNSKYDLGYHIIEISIRKHS